MMKDSIFCILITMFKLSIGLGIGVRYLHLDNDALEILIV
jgi:hypothetical protein